MIKTIVTILLILNINSKRTQLPKLIGEKVIDDPEEVRLAEDEKYVIPLDGQTISYKIQYFPENKGECQFIQPTIDYRSLAQSQAIFKQEEQIQAILPLVQLKLLFIADPYYNIATYSIDDHSMLKVAAPKKPLKPSLSPDDIVAPLLISSSDQQTVYYLTPKQGFVTDSQSLFSHTVNFPLMGNLQQLVKAFEYKGYVFIACAETGLHTYEVQQNKTLTHIQNITNPEQGDLIDIEVDKSKKVLYALYNDRIEVYSFNFPDYYSGNQKRILIYYDTISLEKITFAHEKTLFGEEYNPHINLEISRDREHQTLLVLFEHNIRSVVAEISYVPTDQEYTFIRYYKFIMDIREIHTVENLMVVVGSGILGMFPYGIDPRLIQEEFNGYITLSPVQKLVITRIPFFVGVTKNTIEYGGIFLNKNAGLNCKINSTSGLKNIKFTANLTFCEQQEKQSFNKYCNYEKVFRIEQMQIAIPAPVANSLWIGMIIFLVLIVLGIILMLLINKRKQEEIKKLQLYFQQKRRTSLPNQGTDRQHEDM